MDKKSTKYAFALLLTLGIIISWQSSPAVARDFSLAGRPIEIGLPRWNGNDFSIVPDRPVIEIPVRELPTIRTARRQYRIIRVFEDDNDVRIYRNMDRYSSACRYFGDSYTNRFDNCYYYDP